MSKIAIPELARAQRTRARHCVKVKKYNKAEEAYTQGIRTMLKHLELSGLSSDAMDYILNNKVTDQPEAWCRHADVVLSTLLSKA